MVPPMTRADVKAPIRMAYCCGRGVAPTRKPVFRSCDVVPPLDDAMHTTAATVSAVNQNGGPVLPTAKKIMHVKSRVAIVMPEIGFEDEPISPVKRDDTVTNKKPKTRIIRAPRKPS